MSIDAKLIAVPIWLRQVVKHHGMSTRDLLDINQLQKVLNKNDLTSYVTVNKLLDSRVFTNRIDFEFIHNVVAYVDTLTPINLLDRFKSDSNDGDRTMLDDIDLNSSVFLNSLGKELDQKAGTQLIEMLSTKLVTTTTNAEDLRNYVLDIFEVSDGVYGLTVNPKPETSFNEHIKSNLSLLSMHYKYEDVCNTSLFRYWCSFFQANV